jgi:hypothetical protein
LLLRERLALPDEQARERVPQVVDAAVPEFSLLEDAEKALRRFETSRAVPTADPGTRSLGET